MNLEQIKKELEKTGVNAEVMAEITRKFEELQEIKASKQEDTDENTLTIEQSVSHLNRIMESKGKKPEWNAPKVRRYLDTNQKRDNEGNLVNPYADIIYTDKKPGRAKKTGYRIKKEELDRFIEEFLMTKSDWKERAKKLEIELEKLQTKESEATAEEDSAEEEIAHTSKSEASEEVTVSIFKPIAVVKGTNTKKGQKFFWVDEKTKVRYNGILSDEEDQLIDIKQGAALVKDEELLNEMKEAVQDIINTKMSK